MIIDDIKIINVKKSGFLTKVKTKLTITFSIIDMSLINFYLSFKVKQNQGKRIIKLFQLVYIDKILKKYYLNKVKNINIIMREIEPLLLKTDNKATFSKRKTY